MTRTNLELMVIKHKIKVDTIANVAGLTRQGYYNKVNFKSEWRLSEMIKLYKFFNQYENITLDLLFHDYIERALNEN